MRVSKRLVAEISGAWLKGTACGPSWPQETFRDINVDAVISRCKCFLYRTHDYISCRVGKALYLHTITTFDASTLLLLIWLALAIVAFVRVGRLHKQYDRLIRRGSSERSARRTFRKNHGMLAAADVRKTRLGKVLFLLILSYVLSTFFYKVKYFIRDEGQAQMRHRKQTLLWACLEYICNVSIVFLLQETWWRWVHVPAGKTSQGINSMTWKTGPPFGFRLFDAIGARPGFYARSFLAYTYVASYFFYLVSMILLQVNTDILLPSAAGINGTRIAIMETTTNTYEIFFIACHTWAALSTSMICADFLFAVSYHRNFRKKLEVSQGRQGENDGTAK